VACSGRGCRPRPRARAHAHLHLAPSELVCQRAQRVLDQVYRIHWFQVEFLLTKTGELEDRLDEEIHTRHSSLDEVQGFRDVAVQGLSDLCHLAFL
jgi:hypothetical protein